MTVEARELYSSSMGPIVSGSRTPFRANAHRARAERSLWRRIGEDQSGGNGTILQPITRCAFSPMSELGLGRVKTFSCKRSELEEVATRAIFPDFDYALIAAISG